MFGLGKQNKVKRKEEDQKGEKHEKMLELKNIHLNCREKEKEAVIREIGQMLCDSGYVEETYIEAMLKREASFPTNIGNGIALPHGVEEAKKAIKKSGIAVLVFPEGTDWGGERVKLVIGIAGAGEDHLEILSIIAESLAEPNEVERITTCSREQIYNIFTGKECIQ